MISGKNRSLLRRSLLATALLASTATRAADAPADAADALIARLARPAPATIAFTELRYSALLKAPLRVSGELGYSGPTSLDRRVTTPYREHTAIRGESVRVEREGERARTFALKRAPELRGLLDSFAALLAGDAARVRRNFEVTAAQDASGWRLTLKPRDARAQRRVRQIAVDGAADQPRCFTIENVDGGASVMVFGEAAQKVPASPALETLRSQCSAGF